MKGFMRGAVGVLVGGALGLWGCNSEVSSQEQSRGFRTRADAAPARGGDGLDAGTTQPQ